MNYDYLTDEEVLRMIDKEESSNVRTLYIRLEKKIEEFKALIYCERDAKHLNSNDQLSLFED
jgi:hypothetical protein